MELTEMGSAGAQAAYTAKQATGAVSVTAGQSLKVETAPDGVDMLDAECPAGKVWVATVTVSIKETDV